jgi:hypothetical protein
MPYSFTRRLRGLRLVEVPLLPDDLAALDRVEAGGVETRVDPAGTTADLPVNSGDHRISNFVELREDGLVRLVPSLPETLKPLPDRCSPLERSGRHPRRVRDHLLVGIEQVGEGVDVCAVPGVEPATRTSAERRRQRGALMPPFSLKLKADDLTMLELGRGESPP